MTQAQVKKRTAQFGKNVIEDKGGRSLFKIILSQLSNFLILLLIAASIISLLVKDMVDFYILIIIVIVNTSMGAIQEYRAEKALDSLKKMLPLRVKVIRDGEKDIIPASDLVPGDIIILDSGDSIPADAKLLESTQIRVDEAILTGESVPVRKSIEKDNQLYSGTIIVKGHGLAEVVQTGVRAKIGEIAAHIDIKDKATPLQKRLNYLGKIIAIVAGSLCLVVFILGVIRGFPLTEILIYAVALMISAVPESLPIVTTLALALGVIKMSQQKAVVRHLPAIETLGTINFIASDKTGTLTRNELTVKEIWTEDDHYQVEGTGYEPIGRLIDSNGDFVDSKEVNNLSKLIEIGAICNSADLAKSSKTQDWQIIGDPTEGALLVLAKKTGLGQARQDIEIVKEYSFTSERKMMTVVVDQDREYIAYSKGAPEIIIDRSRRIMVDGQIKPFSKKQKEEWLENSKKMAMRGFRVLAFALKKTGRDDQHEQDLVFTGLTGLVDPPLPDATKSLREAKALGIRTVIVTGDHQLTAKWVAKNMGIKLDDSQIEVGDKLDKLSDKELAGKIEQIKLWARTTPVQKQRLVKAMIKKGWSVAVTGDGVNDAPALKASHVGIAMGKQGTDVARQSADVVLKDDRFSSIISAIKYGRTIYDNIRKFLTFFLSVNFDEIFLIIIAFLANLPQPLTAAQILWVNLITDSFPALAIAFESPDDKELGKPRDPNSSIIKPIIKHAIFIGFISLFFSLIILIVFRDIEVDRLRTYVFTLTAFFQLFIVFSIRSDKPFWQESPFKNRLLVLAVLFSTSLQLLAIYSPLGNLLRTTPLVAWEWLMILSITTVSYFIVEIVKSFKPKFMAGRQAKS